MKNKALTIALILTLCAFSSCGKEKGSGSIADTAKPAETAKVTTAVTEITTAEEKTESTTAEATTAANDDNAEAGSEPADDKSAEEESFTGRWGLGRATIEITDKGEGEYRALIKWGGSGDSFSIWIYPLEPEDGKLVCKGKGTKTNYDLKEGETQLSETEEYTDGSAEFRLEGKQLVWDDLTGHCADGQLFDKELSY